MSVKEIENVLIRREALSERAPLVFDSPHTGKHYPDDFRPSLPLEECEKINDWFVEDLFGDVVHHGGVMIEALFRRAYIDPNRDTRDVDVNMIDGDWPHEVNTSAKTERGVSLMWRRLRGKVDIYDRQLSLDEAINRIERYWRPYHSELKSALDETFDQFGKVFHINCHSMPEMGDAVWGDQGERRADFIIGTRDGTTANPDYVDAVVSSFKQSGYHVTVNDKFKGVELVGRYSDPKNGRESLQIEVNRGIYMDESAITRSERFEQTKSDITKMIEAVAAFAKSRV